MSNDDFENQLQHLRFREIPSEWKGRILRQIAKNETVPEISDQEHWFARMLKGWLWPSPVAWAGFSAVWLISLGLNWVGSDPVICHNTLIYPQTSLIQMAYWAGSQGSRLGFGDEVARFQWRNRDKNHLFTQTKTRVSTHNSRFIHDIVAIGFLPGLTDPACNKRF